MAAISNQTGTRKQIAMQRAEGLTDIWDVFKAWMGRAAEIVLTLCMFAQLIGMLPGVSYPGPTNSIILGVELIMLDFGAFALAPLAEHARNIGQDDAAIKAEAMATWLIRLVMTTIIIVIIGQFSPIFGPGAKYITGFVKYAEPVLILVRVGFIVKYIHVIHSLRGSTLAIEPTHQPTQPIQNEKIAQLEETISGLKEQFSMVIKALETNSSIQLPTQPIQASTQVREEPTHDFSTLMAGLSIIGDVARFATGETIVDQDVPMIEAAHKPVEQVVYPSVPGVSPEKVKQLVALFEAGTQWRDMPGNYSQTVKPVRSMYENLHAV
jgi:hypothetical protein